MMKTLLVLLVGFTACTSSKVKAEKAKVKERVVESSKSEKKNNSTNEIVVKKEDKVGGIFGKAAAKKVRVYRVLRGDKALPLIEKNKYCAGMGQLQCSVGFSKTWSAGITGKELNDCMFRCEKKGSLHGPFERYAFYNSEVEFDRGAYEKNVPTGRWIRGVVVCEQTKVKKGEIKKAKKAAKKNGSEKREKCEEKVLSESNYHPLLGLDGTQRDWAKNGTLIRRQLYKNGIATGKLEEWWDDGKKRTQASYSKRGLDGRYRQWYRNGKLSLVSNYKDGHLHGSYERRSEKGFSLEKGKYDQGKKVGSWVGYFSKGKPKFEEKYDKKGRADGRFCYWKFDGKLLGCFRIAKGSGTFFEYRFDGGISHEYTLLNGERHGVEKSYNFKGNQILETHWDNGRLHGKEIRWDEKGRVMSEVNYRFGKYHGDYYQRYWIGDTSDITHGKYCDNLQCGRWESSTREGNYRVTEYNSKGTLVSEKNYLSTGELEYEWPNGLRNSYQDCLTNMRNGGCCQSAPNLPPGARLCSAPNP